MQYENLGWKTFWIFVSERAKIAVTIGLLAVALGLFSNVATVAVVVRYLIIIFFLALLITVLVAWLAYRRWEYCLDENALRIRRGIVHREEVAIPYRQIQDADIERDILNRLTGTASLAVLTAGHDDADAQKADSEAFIPVMDVSLAEHLQNELLSRANIQKVVAVTPPPAQA